MAGLVWTPEKIVQWIRQLHHQGVDLSPTGIQQTHGRLFNAARSPSQFGSWRAAIQAAGLDYEDVKRSKKIWEPQEILRGIREAEAQGENLLGRGFQARHPQLYLSACSKRRFGSWKQALLAAGLDYEEVRSRRFWNRPRIVGKIQELHRAGEKLIWSYLGRAYPSLYRAARRKENFGSWRQALAAAEISYAEACQPEEWTREGVLEALQELLNLRADLSGETAGDKHPRLRAGAEARFGSWEQALQEARRNEIG